MGIPLHLPAYSTEEGQSQAPQIASALLLGLVVRHLCERLGLPASALMAVLHHEAHTLHTPDEQLLAALHQQLAVIQAVVALPAPQSPPSSA
jgi:hypothetical protein